SDLGISRSQAEEIHQFYLAKLVRLYLLDRQLSSSETADLEKIASLLDLKHKLAWIIELERSVLPPTTENPALPCTGKSICFTGDLRAILNGKQVTREVVHEIVLSKGMIVKNNVSSKLDFLVIADPYSQSTKARRARELNIPLLTEPSFWSLIGVKVD
ncbi:MAG: BRCT domain-containing protein, partial [Haliscomenobacter sp.]